MYPLAVATSCPCCSSKELFSSPAVLMPFVAERAFGWYPQKIDSSWSLRTINNGWAYSICNSLQCKNCDHLFLDIRFGDEQIGRLYKHYREKEYTETREQHEPGYSAIARTLDEGYQYICEIENFIQTQENNPQSILDWGGSKGQNTPFSKSAKQTFIYDISEAKPLNSNHLRNLTFSKVGSYKYDLVCCIHVLEHVPYVYEELNKIRSVMNPFTTLYIEVPCEEIFLKGLSKHELYQSKRHWHEHINFFTEKSLRMLIQRVGMEVVDIRLFSMKQDMDHIAVWQLLTKLPA